MRASRSFFLTETVGLAAGGIVVPGYFALTLNEPVRVVATILVALVTLLIVKLLSRVMLVYGRRMLLLGAGLMALAGAVFAFTDNVVLLTAAASVGVISPSWNEIGPFLSIEQAAVSHLVPAGRRTNLFAWYNLAGSLATALGSLAAGVLTGLLRSGGLPAVQAYRIVLLAYAAAGIVLAALFLFLGPEVEAERSATRFSLTSPTSSARRSPRSRPPSNCCGTGSPTCRASRSSS